MRGIYVLVISLGCSADVAVGKLGILRFEKGLYAYIGSAQVALERRIERHLRKEKRVFWHIDCLLENPSAKILKIFTKNSGRQDECNVAAKIWTRGEAVAGFGCSDCRCKSHLYHVNDYSFLKDNLKEYPIPNPSKSS